MSDSKMQDIHDRLSKQEYRIDSLEQNFSELVITIKENTKAMGQLATNFALSAQKHDENQKDIDRIDQEQVQQGKLIAQMFPTVESLRGVVWKLFGGIVIAMASISGIVAVISKMGS